MLTMHDLWKDSDEPVISAQQPEMPGRARRTRLKLTEAVIVPALRQWLLHDYAAPYCRSLAATRIFRRCYWVDALGGARGALPQALQQVNNTSQALASGGGGDGDGKSPPMTLQGLLLSQIKAVKQSHKEANHPQAEETPVPFTLSKANTIIEADWSSTLPALLAALEQYASIFLLNLFPPTAPPPSKREIPFITQGELAPFFSRSAPTEVCLLISRAQVAQHMLPALRAKSVASAFTALLRSDRWKAQLAQEDEGERGVDAVIDLLRSAMQPHFLAVQRVVFPLLIGPATVEVTPFELLFATRRQDSLLCMNDAMCGYRRRLEEEGFRGLLNEAWFRRQYEARLAQSRQALKERILELGLAQSPRRWPEMRQHMLLAYFGSHLVSEYDQVITELLAAGTLRCEWRGRTTPTAPTAQTMQTPHGDQQERRIPGNDDLLLWLAKKRHY